MGNTIEPISAIKKKPRGGLIAVASRFPEGSLWEQGAQYIPEGCVTPITGPICIDPYPEKPDNDPAEPLDFQPFMIIADDGCNDPWADADEHYDRATRHLDMAQSNLIAKELLDSSVGNPSLQSTAVDVSGGGANNWTAALAALFYNMNNAGYVGDVTVHIPPWLEPAALASRAAFHDVPTGITYSGNNPFAVDSGYSGLIGPGGAAAGAAGGVAGWVYATGPVEYDIGPLLTDIAASADNATNSRYAIAERPAIVRFDTCHVFATLVEANCEC